MISIIDVWQGPKYTSETHFNADIFLQMSILTTVIDDFLFDP